MLKRSLMIIWTTTIPNEVKRNFHSKSPEKLLLTDLTEFAIPAGKVYLSPMRIVLTAC